VGGSVGTTTLVTANIPKHQHKLFANTAKGFGSSTNLTGTNFVSYYKDLTTDWSYSMQYSGTADVASLALSSTIGGTTGHKHEAGNLTATQGNHDHTFTLDDTNIPRTKLYFIEYRGT
jgi:microcystin-dependent protein